MKKHNYRIYAHRDEGRYAIVFKYGATEKVIKRVGSLFRAKAYVESSESRTKGIEYIYDTVEGRRVII